MRHDETPTAHTPPPHTAPALRRPLPAMARTPVVSPRSTPHRSTRIPPPPHPHRPAHTHHQPRRQNKRHPRRLRPLPRHRNLPQAPHGAHHAETLAGTAARPGPHAQRRILHLRPRGRPHPGPRHMRLPHPRRRPDVARRRHQLPIPAPHQRRRRRHRPTGTPLRRHRQSLHLRPHLPPRRRPRRLPLSGPRHTATHIIYLNRGAPSPAACRDMPLACSPPKNATRHRKLPSTLNEAGRHLRRQKRKR